MTARGPAVDSPRNRALAAAAAALTRNSWVAKDLAATVAQVAVSQYEATLDRNPTAQVDRAHLVALVEVLRCSAGLVRTCRPDDLEPVSAVEKWWSALQRAVAAVPKEA